MTDPEITQLDAIAFMRFKLEVEQSRHFADELAKAGLDPSSPYYGRLREMILLNECARLACLFVRRGCEQLDRISPEHGPEDPEMN